LIGIGLNVWTSLAHAPEEVRTMATSLAALHPGRLDVDASQRLLAAILGCFESVLGRLVAGDPELAGRWSLLDVLRDRWVSVDVGTQVVAGWGRGIDSTGALCLHDGQRESRIFGGRVLRSLPPELRAN
jgi:biotin-(acetyl-CoA carboxylase) ligase